jgi:large subunit ribosomal protein L1
VIDEIVRAKPSSSKGKYILSATLATTMGPGIRVDAGKSADRDDTPAAAEAEPEQTAEEPATV